MSDAKAYYHPGFLFASIDAKRDAQDTTPLRKIAFLVFPDFEILDLCGPLDVFAMLTAGSDIPAGRTNQATKSR